MIRNDRGPARPAQRVATPHPGGFGLLPGAFPHLPQPHPGGFGLLPGAFPHLPQPHPGGFQPSPLGPMPMSILHTLLGHLSNAGAGGGGYAPPDPMPAPGFGGGFVNPDNVGGGAFAPYPTPPMHPMGVPMQRLVAQLMANFPPQQGAFAPNYQPQQGFARY